MINELYTLYQCLKKCDIQVGDPHQDIKIPGKSEGYIVGINKNGMPETLEYVSAEKMAKLWTMRKGKHNSFPFVKLKKPILAMTAKNQIYKNYKETKSFKDKKNLLVNGKNTFQLNKQDINLAQWTKEQIAAVKGKDTRLKALEDLVKILPGDAQATEKFFRSIIVLFLRSVEEHTIDLVKTVLLGDVKKDKIICDIPLFFDVSDWHNYPIRVACPEMGMLVSEKLPKSNNSGSRNGHSAFGSDSVCTGTWPDPKLPAIGIAYLFSMNKDALCHRRYGRIASEIFPASANEIKAMHGAIRWCVDDKRKGKTWQGIPNIHRKQDLVISYLEEKPQAEIDLAGAFTSFDASENETAEATYESMAAKVHDALKAEKGLTKDSKVNILVITKVDEGRAQVVLSDAYSIGNITDSLEAWQEGAKNRPYFALFLPGKKEEKAKLIEPFCPSPVEVMRCLQNQWIKGGLDKRDVTGVALRHVYDLYLGDSRIMLESAKMLLQLTLQRLSPLFIGIANADHGGYVDAKDFNFEAKRTTLIGISLLAIILYKLGVKKEEYMKEAAFNLGRLLSLADNLHAQYCKAHMKGKGKDLPPQLLGNAHLLIAFDNPDKALALLGERLRIYYGWATQVQGEEYKLVKWLKGQMGEVSNKLKDVVWPQMADDSIKAQVLLGYLARTKSEE